MKAAVYSGIKKIQIEEVERPKCGPGEILIRVHFCAICGTDVRTYLHGHKKVKPPQIIGHEIAGEIAEMGKETKGYRLGDRVTVVTSVGCGKCRWCQKGYYNLCPDGEAIGYFYQGGFAEYLLMPQEAVAQNAVLKIPENVSLAEASIVEPLSCCINGQNYLKIEKGDNVAVFGAGPIGMMHLELARTSGAEKTFLIDISKEKLEFAQSHFSANYLINSQKENPTEKISSLTENKGVDVVIVAASAKIAQEQALKIAGKKGRVSFFAGLSKDNSIINFDSNILHYQEISIFGSFASYREEYEEALNLIVSKKIEAKKFITHILPLEKIEEGIDLIRAGKTLKVVLKLA